MILTCPACAVRYVVKPNAFMAGPRQVKCAKCQHQWQATPPADFVPPPSDVVQEIVQTIKPVPPGSNLPVVAKKREWSWAAIKARWQQIDWRTIDWKKHALIAVPACAALMVLVIGLTLIYNRQEIVNENPRMADAYQQKGLTVGEPGTNLDLLEVRSEQRLEDGATKLAVIGKLQNVAVYPQDLPLLMATALGADGSQIAHWEIKLDAARLEPGQIIPFSSTVLYPIQPVAEVNLAFKAIDKEAIKKQAEAEEKELEELKKAAAAAKSGGHSSPVEKKEKKDAPAAGH